MTRDFPAYRKEQQMLMGKFGKEAPSVMAGFGQLHEAAMKDGALGTRQKELIALAIGIATRCDGCIAFHTHEALANGASRAEIVETIGVAVMMAGGPGLMYATHAMDALAQFEDSSAGIGKAA